jgi:hypothetical protein
MVHPVAGGAGTGVRRRLLAGIAHAISITILLIQVGGVRTVVIGVTDAIPISIFTRWWLAGITYSVVILIFLAGVVDVNTVVYLVTDPIPITVSTLSCSQGGTDTQYQT